MWDNNRKRKAAKVDTVIGRQTEVLGDVKFSGGMHIDAVVRGGVNADNDGVSRLSLSERGTIEGVVSVPYVVLNGTIIGDVHSSEHIELDTGARVTGDVYYNLIEIASGAQVNGRLVHAPNVDAEGPQVNAEAPQADAEGLEIAPFADSS